MADAFDGDLLFPTQLVDDVWEFGLLHPDPETATKVVQFVFNLNLLFFESMCLRAETILAHPILSAIVFGREIEQDKQSAVFRILQPVFTSDFDAGSRSNPTMCAVAQRMLDDSTHRCVSDDDLVKIAKCIDSCGFQHLWMENDAFRVAQYERLLNAIDRLKNQEEWTSVSQLKASGLTPDLLEQLYLWLESQHSESAMFGLTRLYDHIAQSNWEPPIANQVRALALSVHGETMGVETQSLSGTPEALTPYITAIRSPRRKVKDTDLSDSRDLGESGPSLRIGFPFDGVAGLSLARVMELRDFECFRTARKALVAYRRGADYVSFSRLLHHLRSCSNYLSSYVGFTTEMKNRAANDERYNRNFVDLSKLGEGVVDAAFSAPKEAAKGAVRVVAYVLREQEVLSRPPFSFGDFCWYPPSNPDVQIEHDLVKGTADPDGKLLASDEDKL